MWHQTVPALLVDVLATLNSPFFFTIKLVPINTLELIANTRPTIKSWLNSTVPGAHVSTIWVAIGERETSHHYIPWILVDIYLSIHSCNIILLLMTAVVASVVSSSLFIWYLSCSWPGILHTQENRYIYIYRDWSEGHVDLDTEDQGQE